MRFIVLIITVIGIATPANGEDEETDVFRAIVMAMGRTDSLLAQGQSDRALDEYVVMKGVLDRYMTLRRNAIGQNYLAEAYLKLSGDYRAAAENLQESFAEDPTQKPLFGILEKVMLENLALYDNVAILCDNVGLSAEANGFRELAKDRRYFVETLTAALEPLRKKSREEAMDLISPELRELLTE